MSRLLPVAFALSCLLGGCASPGVEPYVPMEREDRCVVPAVDAAAESCERWSYAFRAGSRDRELERACLGYVDRLRECGRHAGDDVCGTVAHVERPEARRVYECLATRACGTDPWRCSEPRPVGVGRDLCRRLAACGGRCGDFEPFLTSYEGWLRRDVLAAGESCLEVERCEDFATCLFAWLDALTAVR